MDKAICKEGGVTCLSQDEIRSVSCINIGIKGKIHLAYLGEESTGASWDTPNIRLLFWPYLGLS